LRFALPAATSLAEPFPFRLKNRNGGSAFLFDAFSSREPVSIPDQVRDRLSLENALVLRWRLGRRSENNMRAEVERLVEEIKQSVGLLRRHL
jgi:hypothetical protein